MGSLTASERKLARVLLGSYPLAGLEPLSRFVSRASVSPPTAVRFATKLGYTGFPDFQRALREEVHARISSPSLRYSDRRELASIPALAEGAFTQLARNVEETGAALSTFDFEGAVGLLADSRRRILALGGQVSHVLARHLAHQLGQLRPDVDVLPGPGSHLINKFLDFSRRDVLVVFDYKRYQSETVDAARAASAKGTSVILCTDPLLSPISEFAEHVLTFRVDFLPPFDSPVAGMALVEALIATVAARLGGAARARIREFDELNARWMWDRDLLSGENGSQD